MLVSDLMAVVERLAPAKLAQDWDNSGLQAGDEAAEVGRVLVALELTEDVLEEAVTGGCDTVITHHPVLFSGIKSLVEGRPKERLLRDVVRQGVNVMSCHTNLDAAPGGIADVVAEALGLRDTRPLIVSPAGWTKLVGFVPPEAVEKVSTAVFAAGGGGIGSYSECAFATDGVGWFTPGDGARPAVGEPGRAERTPEVRWETVVPRGGVGAAVRAYLEAHPYEEPAFDLYPVEDLLPSAGLGRLGSLASKTTAERLAERVAEVFGLQPVLWSGPGDHPVRRVAVLPGSGRGSVSDAIGRCDALVSGEFSHHDSEAAAAGGLCLIDTPHGQLEWWAFRRWSTRLEAELGEGGVEVALSQRWRDPWQVVAARQ